MLNQLIESKNHHAENVRKNGFLMTVLGIFVFVLLTGWTYSLFAKNFGMGTGDFELSSIVAPVAAVEDTPPPEPEQKPERQQTANKSEKQTVIEKVAPIENSLDKPPRLEDARKLLSAPLKPKDWNDFTEGPENRYRNSDRTDGTNNGDGI